MAHDLLISCEISYIKANIIMQDTQSLVGFLVIPIPKCMILDDAE